MISPQHPDDAIALAVATNVIVTTTTGTTATPTTATSTTPQQAPIAQAIAPNNHPQHGLIQHTVVPATPTMPATPAAHIGTSGVSGIMPSPIPLTDPSFVSVNSVGTLGPDGAASQPLLVDYGSQLLPFPAFTEHFRPLLSNPLKTPTQFENWVVSMMDIIRVIARYVRSDVPPGSGRGFDSAYVSRFVDPVFWQCLCDDIEQYYRDRHQPPQPDFTREQITFYHVRTFISHRASGNALISDNIRTVIEKFQKDLTEAIPVPSTTFTAENLRLAINFAFAKILTGFWARQRIEREEEMPYSRDRTLIRGLIRALYNHLAPATRRFFDHERFDVNILRSEAAASLTRLRDVINSPEWLVFIDIAHGAMCGGKRSGQDQRDNVKRQRLTQSNGATAAASNTGRSSSTTGTNSNQQKRTKQSDAPKCSVCNRTGHHEGQCPNKKRDNSDGDPSGGSTKSSTRTTPSNNTSASSNGSNNNSAGNSQKAQHKNKRRGGKHGKNAQDDDDAPTRTSDAKLQLVTLDRELENLRPRPLSQLVAIAARSLSQDYVGFEPPPPRIYVALSSTDGTIELMETFFDTGAPVNFMTRRTLHWLNQHKVPLQSLDASAAGATYINVSGVPFKSTAIFGIRGRFLFSGAPEGEVAFRVQLLDTDSVCIPLIIGRQTLLDLRVFLACSSPDGSLLPLTFAQKNSPFPSARVSMLTDTRVLLSDDNTRVLPSEGDTKVLIPDDDTKVPPHADNTPVALFAGSTSTAVSAPENKVHKPTAFDAPVVERVARKTLHERRLPTADELADIEERCTNIWSKELDVVLQKKKDDVSNLAFLNDRQKARAAAIFDKYRDAFWTYYRKEPMTIVPPTKTMLREEARPQRPAFRSPPSFKQQLQIWSMMITLMAFNVISWVADTILPGACHTFMTNGRPVVDTSVQKSLVERTPDRATTIPEMMQTIAGSPERNRFFLSYDLSKIFHHVAYHPDSSPEARYTTFLGRTFKYDRLIMGGVTSMYHLNEVLDQAYSHIPGHARYADDGRIGARTVDELLDRAEAFLQCSIDYNIPVNPTKFVLIAESTYWCGYHVSKDGHIPDPRSVEVIMSMGSPSTAEDLVKVLGIARWVSAAIPDLQREIAPLQDLVKSAAQIIRASGNVTSPKAAHYKRIPIARLNWTPVHDACWSRLRDLLATRITLQHRDQNKILILVTDASNIGWAGILGQIPPEDLGKPILEMRFEPLGCMGGNFSGAQCNWPTIEKEAYAIKRTVERLWHVIDDGTTLYIFTDHKNLAYIFNPDGDYLRSKPIPSRDRLLRWASQLAVLSYEIRHIDGDDNVFADFISRLRNIPPDTFPDPDVQDTEDVFTPVLFAHMLPLIEGCVASSLDSDKTALVLAALESVYDPDWVQPTILDIYDIAGKDGMANASFSDLASQLEAEWDNDMLVWRVKGKILIPEGTIRTRLLIMAHCGSSGHRGRDATIRQLKTFVFWPSMDRDVADFVSNCLYCKAHYYDRVRRPFGSPQLARQRNEILTLDFVHIGPSDGGKTMLLVIMDRLSSFTRLYPTESENSVDVVEALLDWFSTYGVPTTLATDQGPGFTAKLTEQLTDRLGIDHHLISAGIHMPQGRVERLNRDLLSILRKLITEQRLDDSLWLSLVPITQMAINHTPVPSLGGLAPVTVFLGLEPSLPLRSFFVHPQTKMVTEVPVSDPDIRTLTSELVLSLREREIATHELQEQAHLQRAAKQARRRGVDHTVFEVGDWVMVRSNYKSKLAPKWIGPARVTEVLSDGHKVCVDFLDDDKSKPGKRKTLYHVSQVLFYNYHEAVLSKNAAAFRDYLARKEYAIAELRRIKYNSNAKFWQVLVEWETGDVSWEPLHTVDSSSPELVDLLLHDMHRQGEDISEVQKAREHYRRKSPTANSMVASRDGVVASTSASQPQPKRQGRRKTQGT